jgi:hypothetical protein
MSRRIHKYSKNGTKATMSGGEGTWIYFREPEPWMMVKKKTLIYIM